ncbi:MAG: CoA transferase [Candidatus Lokiarchaeota archaeon]|nr:CoA transferase [Candidatus Lokiarchaeota archaeon]
MSKSLPLKGIRVLDFSRMLPGPYCSMILADLGAEVIRIEDPNFLWGNPPPFYEGTSISAFNAILNRNSKSISLNLKKASKGALDVVQKFVKKADIIVEGFRPGVTKKLGIDYDSLSQINPSIVYCSITGYGQTSPKSKEAGHDINYLSLSGLLGLNIHRDHEDPQPVIPCVQVADIGGALYAVIGILAALKKREGAPDKKGDHVDISMADCVLSMNPMVAAFEFTNTSQEENILHGGNHPYYSIYRTKDGKFMAVGAIEMKFYTNLCNALELPQYIPKQYARGEERKEIYEKFRKKFLSKTKKEWIKIFEKFEACVTPIQSFGEALKEPHYIDRKMIKEEIHPKAGKIKSIGSPIKFRSSSLQINRNAPKVGENTHELLISIGYSNDEINEMKKRGIFR